MEQKRLTLRSFDHYGGSLRRDTDSTVNFDTSSRIEQEWEYRRPVEQVICTLKAGTVAIHVLSANYADFATGS
jgi:hypothetical protein